MKPTMIRPCLVPAAQSLTLWAPAAGLNSRAGRSRRPVRRAGPSAGFTLVEVMVVMLIMSGLLVSISQVLNAARSTRDLIYNVQETQLSGPAILDLIERDVRGLFLFTRFPGDALLVRDRVSAGFDADSIQLVTSNNALLRTESRDEFVRSDICEVGYVVRPNPDAPNDFLEIWRRENYGVDDLPFEGGRFSFLHDRVKGFDIQLFEDIGDNAEPLDAWEEGNHKAPLPRRIEITLTLELAPRLVGESLAVAPTDKRTLEYKRVIAMPNSLLTALDLQPVPRPPEILPPVPGQAPGAGGGAAGGGAGQGNGPSMNPGGPGASFGDVGGDQAGSPSMPTNLNGLIGGGFGGGG
jgi:prepilin-type N-terminal cleavage/methylation domain-containing protein